MNEEPFDQDVPEHPPLPEPEAAAVQLFVATCFFFIFGGRMQSDIFQLVIVGPWGIPSASLQVQ